MHKNIQCKRDDRGRSRTNSMPIHYTWGHYRSCSHIGLLLPGTHEYLGLVVESLWLHVCDINKSSQSFQQIQLTLQTSKDLLVARVQSFYIPRSRIDYAYPHSDTVSVTWLFSSLTDTPSLMWVKIIIGVARFGTQSREEIFEHWCVYIACMEQHPWVSASIFSSFANNCWLVTLTWTADFIAWTDN